MQLFSETYTPYKRFKICKHENLNLNLADTIERQNEAWLKFLIEILAYKSANVMLLHRNNNISIQILFTPKLLDMSLYTR